ncbi:MAG: hypothetical protein HeimC3_29430 [Candidatus Heimdallarchaeota archaeon LC_3]|nr:MAG: hypothetical protein HeimC3_29430 [Candidatus Heimdallarchaeota archaeon LC_3]
MHWLCRQTKKRKIINFLVILLFILPLLNQNAIFQINDNTNFEESKSNTPENTSSEVSRNDIRKSLQFFQTPSILFIVDDETAPHSNYDQPFYDYMTNTLGYIVTLHSDNNSYPYSNYDAVVISQSIAEDNVVNSLSNITVPILTMEVFSHDEFRLSNTRGVLTSQTDIKLVNTSSHYILEGSPSPTVTIYNASLPINYLKDYTLTRIDEITSLTATISASAPRRTLIALDRGKLDWYGIPAYERRVFWSGGDGSHLTSDGWKLFNTSLHWVLYDDNNGSANIQVDVTDLNSEPLENTNVTLINLNTLQNWSNSSISGSTSFSGIPYGIYNISADFQGTINNSLINLGIYGSKTYETQRNFIYSIIIDDYIDDSPPLIQNVDFFDTNDTFAADVFDVSGISIVTLNITVVNGTNGSIIRDNSSQMVTTNGIRYFNDTSLLGIPGSDIIIYYNITAIDLAGNIAFSSNQTVNLADKTAPTIHEYNSTIFGNGTIFFYANITDNQSSVHQVLIRINNSDFSMVFEPSSGFWTYSAEFGISGFLNFTIYSAIDVVGNEAGLANGSLSPLPDYLIIILSDSQAPHIYGVTDTFNTHEYGFVEITAFIDDWNIYQSGVNISSVDITLIINGKNSTIPMIPLGSIVFALNYQFNFSDVVSYIISARDYADNLAIGNLHGNFTIDDTIKPIVNYGVQEYGNGTVEFSSLITDWPSNQTSAVLFYTQDFFGSWTKLDMIDQNGTYFSITIRDLSFRPSNIWYYIIANDTNNNYFVPTPDQYLNISLTDMVRPIVIFSIENSTINDGETTIRASATDPYGETNFINNTFQVKITTNQSVNMYEMHYESLFTYSYTQSFFYGETIVIQVFTNDNAGNIGNLTKEFLISDYAPPKINEFGVINHKNGSITIWANIVEDMYGSGLPDGNNSIILEYIFQQYFSETMIWNGTGNYYTILISGFEPGDSIPFNILATDNEGNIFQTPTYSEPFFLTIGPEIIDYGVEYDQRYLNQAKFWIDIDFPFVDKSKMQVNITVFDNTTDDSWINQTMIYNGSHFVFRLSIPYQHNFAYNISIKEESKFGDGFVSNSIGASAILMPDKWAPTIHETGAIQLDDFTILVWADVSDIGSDVSEVKVFYSFESVKSSARLSSVNELKSALMAFNGSLYVVSISVTDSGTFHWEIFASDNSNLIIETSFNNQLLFIKTQPSSFEIFYLYIIIGIISIIGIILIVRAVILMRKRKAHYIQECSRKLDEIEKIFMINIQTSNGLPILVKKSSVNPQFNIDPLMLSGYISATTTVRGELVSQMQMGEEIKEEIISKTEQSSDRTLNMLTTKSDDIIFITFTSATVSKWLQDIQLKAHKELKQALKQKVNKRLIDDLIQIPAENAVSKHLPLVLLDKFSIFPNTHANNDDLSHNQFLLTKFLLWHTSIRGKVHKLNLNKVNEEYRNFKQQIDKLPSFTIQSVREVLIHAFDMKSDKIFELIWSSALKKAFVKKLSQSNVK